MHDLRINMRNPSNHMSESNPMKRKGPCYSNSLELLTRIKRSPEYSSAENKDLRESACLVHGYVTACSGPEKGERFDHAWVDALGFVLDGDPSEPSAKSWSEFEREFLAVERIRYSLEEAEELKTKWALLGPWDLLANQDTAER
jgi:hypothetical protein